MGKLLGKMNVCQWAEEDRPRHKLNSLGAEALTNAELLSILIGTGSRNPVKAPTQGTK